MQIVVKYFSLGLFLFFGIGRLDARTTDTDREVYLTALNYFYDEIITPSSGCMTISYRAGEFIPWGPNAENTLKDLDSCTMENFMKCNGVIDREEFTAYLYRIFDGVPDVHIISKEETEELAKNPTRRVDFWKRFNKKYPCSGGHLFLSPIGYNEDQTEAVFYLENLFHSLVGAGFLVVCEFSDGEWRVKKIVEVLQI